jgi:hypothetical protein
MTLSPVRAMLAGSGRMLSVARPAMFLSAWHLFFHRMFRERWVA